MARGTPGRIEALDRNREARERVVKADAPKDFVIRLHEYDHILFGCVIVLVLFGLIMVLSSSYYIAMKDENKSTFQFFISQSRAGFFGLILLLVAAFFFDYHWYRRFAPIAYIGANFLVVITKFIGVEVYGAKRWIQVPLLGQFQPSELAKAALILTLAAFICGDEKKFRNRASTWRGVAVCAILTAIPALLVFVFNNNMSTALIIAAIGLGITFIACPLWKPMLALLAAGGTAMYLFFYVYLAKFVFDDTHPLYRWAARIRASVNPWEDPTDDGYQTIQSLFAVASGGWAGLGLGQSNQKLKFMPEPQNDFIFAVICEELGFIGAFAVLLIFGILIWRGARIAANAPDLPGVLIAGGIVTQIAAQVVINVAVVTNTGINTGVPMPFISAGGTSLLIVMGLMGILLNISKYSVDRG